MRVRAEIENYSSDMEKPTLLWLFNRFHMQSEWNVMAYSTILHMKNTKYGFATVWHPSFVGQVLYNHREDFIEMNKEEN